MNDKQLEGSLNEVKGKVKEGVGNLTGDSSLKTEGQVDQLSGKVQKTVGDAQGALADIGDSIKGATEPKD